MIFEIFPHKRRKVLCDALAHPVNCGKENRKKMSEFLTKKEVAAKLRVTTRTINNYMTQGKLSFIRLSPKIVFFRASDIEAFIEESTIVAA